MQNYRTALPVALALALLSFSYSTAGQKKETLQKPTKVEIKKKDGKYSFYLDNKPFALRGVGGGGNLMLLNESGGNALRTWGSRNGQQLLDTAAKYDIMVAMGLGMGQELHGFDYNDTAAVNRQFRRNKEAVDALKNHPNLLCWVVGNELNLSPNRGRPVNPKVYGAVKEIVDYIHREDPNHPVTTAFAGVSKQQVEVALEHCPDLDFLSFQVYGGLGSISQQVNLTGISLPFAITEFGPVGHWERPRTEWGREIEECSAVKASGLYERIQSGIVNDPTGLCLGGFAFLWGQKQERTPTWYGMFLKSGEATAVVDELTRYWTGSYPANRAPKLDSITIDEKDATENITLRPGIQCRVEVFVSDPEGDPLGYEWVMLKEVRVRSQGGAREEEPASVPIRIISEKEGLLEFSAPEEPGEYRLFSYVYDRRGKAGTANIPFYVK